MEDTFYPSHGSIIDFVRPGTEARRFSPWGVKNISTFGTIFMENFLDEGPFILDLQRHKLLRRLISSAVEAETDFLFLSSASNIR